MKRKSSILGRLIKVSKSTTGVKQNEEDVVVGKMKKERETIKIDK